MNELVTPETGLLVDVASQTPRHLGTCFKVDQLALEATIGKAIGMSTEQKAEIGAAARAGFDAIRTSFAERLGALLGDGGGR